MKKNVFNFLTIRYNPKKRVFEAIRYQFFIPKVLFAHESYVIVKGFIKELAK